MVVEGWEGYFLYPSHCKTRLLLMESKSGLVETWVGGSGFVLGGVIAAHLFFDLSLAMRSQLLKFLALQPPLPHLLASLRNGAALAFA